MEGIVRSLMVKGAPPVVLDTLIEKFKHLINNDSSYKDSVALAIGYLAKKSDFNRVAELVRDRSHGETRFFLIRSLPRIDKKQAGDVLLEILGQPGILATTIAALSILRDARAKPFILPLANGCKPSSSEERRIQQLAKKYLSRLA
jgi:hypothetical protein